MAEGVKRKVVCAECGCYNYFSFDGEPSLEMEELAYWREGWSPGTVRTLCPECRDTYWQAKSRDAANQYADLKAMKEDEDARNHVFAAELIATRDELLTRLDAIQAERDRFAEAVKAVREWAEARVENDPEESSRFVRKHLKVEMSAELIKGIDSGFELAQDLVLTLLDRILEGVSRIRYGCHCEIEIEGVEPDDCVLDGGDPGECIYAKPGMKPADCEYWRPIGTERRGDA